MELYKEWSEVIKSDISQIKTCEYEENSLPKLKILIMLISILDNKINLRSDLETGSFKHAAINEVGDWQG